jgi:hypothetical protein
LLRYEIAGMEEENAFLKICVKFGKTAEEAYCMQKAMSGNETFICFKKRVIGYFPKMAEFPCKIVHSCTVHQHCTFRNQVTYATCLIHDCKRMTIREFTEKYQQNPLQGSQ